MHSLVHALALTFVSLYAVSVETPKLDPDFEPIFEALLADCKEIREGRSGLCDYTDTPHFDEFVKHIAKQLPFGKTLMSPTDWKLRCLSGILVTDPPVCFAVAYMAVPFRLTRTESEVDRVDCERTTFGQGQHEGGHSVPNLTDYELIPLTVETRNPARFSCTLMRMSCALDIHFDILGQGFNGKMTRAMKIKFVSDRLRKIPEKDRSKTIILSIDSSDTMIQIPKETILQRFLSSKARVLISAEMPCFPFRYFPMNMGLGNNTLFHFGDVSTRYDDFQICGKLFPRAFGRRGSIHTRFLNSGGWIGFADTMIEAYESLNRIPEWFLNKWPGSDQGVFSMLYLSQRFGMQLDVCSNIFQSINSLESESEEASYSYWRLYAKGPRSNLYNLVYLTRVANTSNETRTSPFEYLWVNKATERIPAILHFNGAQFNNKVVGYTRVAEKRKVLGETMLPIGKISTQGPDTQQWLEYCRPLKRMELATNAKIPKKCWEKYEFMSYCKKNLKNFKERNCSFEDHTLQKLLNKDMSGLGFFIEMSPVRYFTMLSYEEHKKFAEATFAATKAVGIEAWLSMVDGAHIIPGQHATNVAYAYLHARKLISGLSHPHTHSWPLSIPYITPLVFVAFSMFYIRGTIRSCFMCVKRTISPHCSTKAM
mmetsp:Transcript_22807/g.55392  ORF Transcript_22807/g.55392 Transcript_22807/m.55392 type:complete len:653 (-) Transcript_22807:123-2081(-)